MLDVWIAVLCAEDESLFWTKIGAIGSWAGSVFGAIALVISILAFRLPQKSKIKVGIGTGFMLSQFPGMDRIDAYIITVKNVGMRPVTVTNVYLHFGNKKKGDIWVGMLNKESPLGFYDPVFPKRLEQGESFEYYLLKDKLNTALTHQLAGKEEKTSKFSVRVDEVSRGTKYYKTKWTLGTFVDRANNQQDNVN